MKSKKKVIHNGNSKNKKYSRKKTTITKKESNKKNVAKVMSGGRPAFIEPPSNAFETKHLDGVSIDDKLYNPVVQINKIKSGNLLRQINNKNSGTLKVVSYNIENREYAYSFRNDGRSYYSQVDVSLLPTHNTQQVEKQETRATIIAKELLELDADIICLQECVKDDFTIISGLLTKYGSDYSNGNYTVEQLVFFWKNNKFQSSNITFQGDGNNRFKILTLEGKGDFNDNKFAIVNAHLQGPGKNNTNDYTQSNNNIDKIKTQLRGSQYETHIKLICGDFNNPFYGSVTYNNSKKTINTGSNILTSDGFTDVYKNQQINIESKLGKEYTNNDNKKKNLLNDDGTTITDADDLPISNFKGKQLPLDAQGNPFAPPFANLIDYILCQTDQLEPKTVLQLPTISYIGDYLQNDNAIVSGHKVVEGNKKLGLPNLFRQTKKDEKTTEGEEYDEDNGRYMVVFPSDHVPLYAEFDFKNTGTPGAATGTTSEPKFTPPPEIVEITPKNNNKADNTMNIKITSSSLTTADLDNKKRFLDLTSRIQYGEGNEFKSLAEFINSNPSGKIQQNQFQILCLTQGLNLDISTTPKFFSFIPKLNPSSPPPSTPPPSTPPPPQININLTDLYETS